MTLWIWLAVSFAGGLALGLFFFGGLRATLAWAHVSDRPALVIFVSFVARMGILLGGLFALAGQNWERYLTALAGLLTARLLSIRLWGPARVARKP